MVQAPFLEKGHMYHAFIAHSSEDRDVTEKLTKMLEDQEFKCFMYERDLAPDGTIVTEVSRNIKMSRRVILILSEAFIDSRWSMFEAMEAIHKQYADKRIVLVPVLYNLTEAQIPDYLRPYRCINYTDEHFNTLIMKALTEDIAVTDLIPAGNVAHGLAWSYYYGYLKLVLPGIADRTEDWLSKRKNDPEMLKKMVIIIPTSCRCPQEFPTHLFEHVGYIGFKASRAGNKERDYKSSVYKVKDPKSKQEYLFIAEFATPVMSMWEMETCGIAGLTREEKYHQRMLFGAKLQEILYHPMNKECHHRSTYLEFNDEDEGYENFPGLLCDHIRRELKKDKNLQQCTEELNLGPGSA